MSTPRPQILAWTPASDAEIRTGLLGYLRIEYGALVVDGVTLRRTAQGRLALSFPVRVDRAGKRHALVRPIDAAAREEIERFVLAELGQSGAL